MTPKLWWEEIALVRQAAASCFASGLFLCRLPSTPFATPCSYLLPGKPIQRVRLIKGTLAPPLLFCFCFVSTMPEVCFALNTADVCEPNVSSFSTLEHYIYNAFFQTVFWPGGWITRDRLTEIFLFRGQTAVSESRPPASGENRTRTDHQTDESPGRVFWTLSAS